MQIEAYLNQLDHLVGISLLCREYNSKEYKKLKILQQYLNNYKYISAVVNTNSTLHVDTMAIVSNMIIIEDILNQLMLKILILAIPYQRFEYPDPLKEPLIVYPQNTQQILNEINKAISERYRIIFKPRN